MAKFAQNPQTGEVIENVDGQWIPLKTAGNPETGEVVVMREGQWIPLQQLIQPSRNQRIPEEDITLADKAKAGLSMGVGALSQIPAGLWGLANAAIPGGQSGGEAVRQAQEAMTYSPESQGAQQTLQDWAWNLQPIGDAYSGMEQKLGDIGMETGSPLVATAMHTAPSALLELLGLGALRRARGVTKLIDDQGRPTKALRDQLNKQGLVYENLSPEAKALIPNEVTPDSMIPMRQGFTPGAVQSERAVAQQLADQGTDASLATKRLTEGGRVVGNPAGKEAIKQGFRPGFVRSIEVANPSTKNRMRAMLEMKRRIAENERLAADMRPWDIPGKSVVERINFVREKANAARQQLDSIAEGKLRGQRINTAPIEAAFDDALTKLNIRDRNLVNGVRVGKPDLDFRDSIIAADRGSQRMIKDAVMLMERGSPDAYRFHTLKRQLDALIDYNKKSKGGIPEKGRDVLKSLRAELNNQLRSVNDDYARVNDVLSLSLDTFDKLNKATGSTDIFSVTAATDLGTDLRGLLSNVKSRGSRDQALTILQDTVEKLGGSKNKDLVLHPGGPNIAGPSRVFDDDIKQLVIFADGLDDRFMTNARTSLGGQVGQQVERGLQQGANQTMWNAVATGAGKAVDKMRGVNDYNAYESILELLNTQ